MRHTTFLAALTALTLSWSTANAIIQGEPAERAYADSYAAISFASLRTCGAVALDAKHVLTGAHCLTIGGVDFADILNSIGLLSVVKGNVSPDAADQSVSVADIVVHPDYKMDFETGAIMNDIAIIVLDDGDELEAPFAQIAEKVPAQGVAVGLGMNDRFDLGQPDVIYQVELDVFDIDGGSIAAGKRVSTPIPSICWGDSGGGFYQPVEEVENSAAASVFGLVSWEPEPSRCTDKATERQYFTNVVYYRDWIEEQLRKS